MVGELGYRPDDSTEYLRWRDGWVGIVYTEYGFTTELRLSSYGKDTYDSRQSGSVRRGGSLILLYPYL